MATLEDILESTETGLHDIIMKFKTDNFIETGTGLGDTVYYCLYKGFKQIISIEIHEKIAQKAIHRFANSTEAPDIKIGDSVAVLKEILPNLKGNSLFWLDAHFPGVDFKYANFGDEQDEEKRIPLKKELEVISNSKDISKDVFIIDDLRIYEDGLYEAGNWDLRNQFGGDTSNFIFDTLSETHNIVKYNQFQGFLICLPKDHDEDI